MANALASAGASVAVLGRNAERGMERAEDIRREGGEAIFVSADALDRDSLTKARDHIEKSMGAVDILVNAAGGNQAAATLQPGDDFCELSLDAWRDVFDLNLIGGTVLPSQVFGESMLLRNSGSIINIASMSGIIPLSRVVAYSAAKAAVQLHQPRIFPRRPEQKSALQRRRKPRSPRSANHFSHAHCSIRIRS